MITRRGRVVFIAVMCLIVLPFTYGQRKQKAPEEQTLFQLEAPFKRTVALPPDVLDVLRADELNQQGFQTCPKRGRLKEIPAKWFAASQVNLGDKHTLGLVVKAGNACLWGANIGPFWVFRETSTGYELVLTERALGLELLPTRTNGYRDIEVSAATANVVLTREYKFTADKYALSSKQMRTSQW